MMFIFGSGGNSATVAKVATVLKKTTFTFLQLVGLAKFVFPIVFH